MLNKAREPGMQKLEQKLLDQDDHVRAAASYTMGSPAPAPQPPKESFARRYKFLWPLLLAVNFTVGAYLFMRTKKKDTGITEEDPLPSPSITQPVKLPEPIPESQQGELFKHILEEKRKVKRKHPEEKKQLGEGEALLKTIYSSKIHSKDMTHNALSMLGYYLFFRSSASLVS
ncbi:hypothetical protein DITRI_Ditri11bG0034300 [Diplodiscus trichospermus]